MRRCVKIKVCKITHLGFVCSKSVQRLFKINWFTSRKTDFNQSCLNLSILRMVCIAYTSYSGWMALPLPMNTLGRRSCRKFKSTIFKNMFCWVFMPLYSANGRRVYRRTAAFESLPQNEFNIPRWKFSIELIFAVLFDGVYMFSQQSPIFSAIIHILIAVCLK